jgi:serine/threonine protein phosphatase PrpC
MKITDKQNVTLTLEITAKTNTGMQREANEDNFVVTPNAKSHEWILPKGEYPNTEAGTVLVVADGMGGLNAGEVASKIAIGSIKDFFIALDEPKKSNFKDILADAIFQANTDIVEHSKQFTETAGMGSTIVLAILKGSVLHVAWVGDSRCYLWRNEALTQVSKDHSYVQTLVDQGKLTKEQAFIHPDSNVITQSLGAEGRKPHPDYVSITLADKDIILLCSDGLNSMLWDDEIAKIIKENDGLPQTAERLIGAANNEGGLDNITVLMAKVVSGAETAPADPQNAQTLNNDTGEVGKKKPGKVWYAILIAVIIAVAGYFVAGALKQNHKKDHDKGTKPVDTSKKVVPVVPPRAGGDQHAKQPVKTAAGPVSASGSSANKAGKGKHNEADSGKKKLLTLIKNTTQQKSNKSAADQKPAQTGAQPAKEKNDHQPPALDTTKANHN